MNPRPRFLILPDLPIILAPLVLFARMLWMGEAIYWGIPTLQFIPWHHLAWNQLQAGIFPLWNSLNGMGAPLMANYQLALFYPPSWVLFVFSALGGVGWLAWGYSLVVVAHLIWAGLGMARLIRMLGMSRLAQTVGGLAFCLSGYLVARAGFFSMVWVAAWMPWVLRYASEIASPVSRNPGLIRKKAILGLILSLAMQMLAGHAQLTWYTILFVSFWVGAGAMQRGGWKDALRSMGYLFVCGVAAFGLSAVQLIPTAEYLMQSQRSTSVIYEVALGYSFWPWRFLTFFAPDFFGNPGQGTYWGFANYWEDAVYLGVLPLLMALGSIPLLFCKKGNLQYQTLTRFLWVWTAAAIVFALGQNTPVFPFLFDHVPTFDLFQAPSRMMIWVVTSLCLLAAIEIDRWHTPSGRGLYWLRLGTAGAFAMSLGAILAMILFPNVNLTFIRATAWAGVLTLIIGGLTLWKSSAAKRGLSATWQGLVVMVLIVDLLSAGWWLTPAITIRFFSNMTQVLPEPVENGLRVFLVPEDEYLIRFHRFFRFQDFRWLEKTENFIHVQLPNTNLFTNTAMINNFDPLVPDVYQKWVDGLARASGNAKDALLRLSGAGWMETFTSQSSGGVSFRKVEDAARVHWFGCAKGWKDQAQARLATFEAAEFGDERLMRVVNLETESINDEPCTDSDEAVIMDFQETPLYQRVTVKSQRQGWIMISDIAYPGWEAHLDGEQVQLLRADGTFRAVLLPAGTHLVEFRYRPVSFSFGLIVSFLSLTFLVIFFWKIMRSGGCEEIRL